MTISIFQSCKIGISNRINYEYFSHATVDDPNETAAAGEVRTARESTRQTGMGGRAEMTTSSLRNSLGDLGGGQYVQ